MYVAVTMYVVVTMYRRPVTMYRRPSTDAWSLLVEAALARTSGRAAHECFGIHPRELGGGVAWRVQCGWRVRGGVLGGGVFEGGVLGGEV